ncbi:MAG: hypothetical protein WCY82_11720, partial [Desulfotomaculaceae bacterium]
MKKPNVYHNSQDSYYRDPFGAVACGEVVSLRVAVEGAESIGGCELRVWEGNAAERFFPMTLMRNAGTGEARRQVFTINYQAPAAPGLVWYYFRLAAGDKVFYYGNNVEGLGGEGSLQAWEPPGFQITVFLPGQIPLWYKQGVMYQIYVDRFYPHPEGGPALDGLTGGGPAAAGPGEGGKGQMLRKGHKGRGDLLHIDWYDTPFYIKDEKGRIDRWTFFGGNLAGIIDKLDYLQGLGV